MEYILYFSEMKDNQYKNFRFDELISLFDLHNLTHKLNFEDNNIDLVRTALESVNNRFIKG